LKVKLPKVVVLRWGHRLRDKRLTTHVALAARALGASGIIITDVEDEKLKKTINKVVETWGGSFFFQIGPLWKTVMKDWKTKGGKVIHLTVYGENIQTSDVIRRIKRTGRDILVIVGSRKVPSQFFSRDYSDFNVAVGNQPHSECSSLAIFLDRFFEGRELAKRFEGARLRIMPRKHGKKLLRKAKFESKIHIR